MTFSRLILPRRVGCNSTIKEYTVVLSKVFDKELILEFRLIELKLAVCSILVGHIITKLTLHVVNVLDDIVTVEEHKSCK